MRSHPTFKAGLEKKDRIVAVGAAFDGGEAANFPCTGMAMVTLTPSKLVLSPHTRTGTHAAPAIDPAPTLHRTHGTHLAWLTFLTEHRPHSP